MTLRNTGCICWLRTVRRSSCEAETLFFQCNAIDQKVCVDVVGEIKRGVPDEMQWIMWLVDTAEQIGPEASGVTAV